MGSVLAAGSPRIRAWFHALSSTLEHPLESYTRARLEKRLSDRLIREQLAPMLAVQEKVDARELLSAAWAVVEPLMNLAPDEREFIHAIQAGDLRPHLLAGDDQSLADRIRQHPAIQWKVQNAIEHRTGKHGRGKRR